MLDDDDTLADPGSDLSADDVRRQIDDWLTRLQQFFEGNRTWAQQQGWSVDESDRVWMNEDLMQRFQIAKTEQPVQRLDNPNGGYALFKPKGLWVIGANGRIDLYTGKGAFVIVDRAESGQPSSWTLFRANAGPQGVLYDPTVLERLT